METINKAQLREFVKDNKHIIIKDIHFNDNTIYNPRYNDGMGFIYTENRINKTTDYLWREARMNGSVIIDNKEYQVL